ncbi:hypothetical protein [Terrabacter sp. MAHUQ-38]|uniref:hypothetical protein n=1 Tax=unclassified Terrabacter TaxID=2630222 RepID=UPI00165D9037|nr:hypothetical protein [Terrabacter sp. MAHUQ-38]MBC9821097.1 hypothetical protein [Terrabacter sp. MAHUQ-38]
MSTAVLGDDDTTMTVMTGSERAAMLERLAEVCTTSVTAPVGAPRNRERHAGRSSLMWRCQ